MSKNELRQQVEDLKMLLQQVLDENTEAEDEIEELKQDIIDLKKEITTLTVNTRKEIDVEVCSLENEVKALKTYIKWLLIVPVIVIMIDIYLLCI